MTRKNSGQKATDSVNSVDPIVHKGRVSASTQLHEIKSKIARVQSRWKSLLDKYANNDDVMDRLQDFQLDDIPCISPCWNIKTRAYYSDTADRTASMLSGPFFCSDEYPWPKHEGDYMEPVVQLDLRTISKLRGLNFGDGILQVFHDVEDFDPAGFVRVVPREVADEVEPTPPPTLEEFADKMCRTPTCWLVEPNDWNHEDGTFREISGFSKPLISSAVTLDQFDETDDWPKDLKSVLKEILSLYGNDYSTHMFGTFAAVQYSGYEMPSCLMNFESDQFGYGWGDGSAQVFYEFVDGKANFSFNWSCG